jgi:hypothetical protein
MYLWSFSPHCEISLMLKLSYNQIYQINDHLPQMTFCHVQLDIVCANNFFAQFEDIPLLLSRFWCCIDKRSAILMSDSLHVPWGLGLFGFLVWLSLVFLFGICVCVCVCVLFACFFLSVSKFSGLLSSLP